jgi:uncharacterized protein (TIGR03000 family)
MVRNFLVPAVLGLAVLGIAADSAQAQLFSRMAQRRQMWQERRDMRRGVVTTRTESGMVVNPRSTQGSVYTYSGPGYTTQSISYYYSPSGQPALAAATANIRVILPDAKAKVFVDGAATEQTGLDRLFVTPNLQPGNYNYVLRVVYMLNGQELAHERTITVSPGRTTVLDLTRR